MGSFSLMNKGSKERRARKRDQEKFSLKGAHARVSSLESTQPETLGSHSRQGEGGMDMDGQED